MTAPGTGLALSVAFARITFDSTVMWGRARIRGLRMPVATVVRIVASGMSVAEIIDAHPELGVEGVAEALTSAAPLADDRIIPLRPTGS